MKRFFGNDSNGVLTLRELYIVDEDQNIVARFYGKEGKLITEEVEQEPVEVDTEKPKKQGKGANKSAAEPNGGEPPTTGG